MTHRDLEIDCRIKWGNLLLCPVHFCHSQLGWESIMKFITDGNSPLEFQVQSELAPDDL
jgi:hypothetical protein